MLPPSPRRVALVLHKWPASSSPARRWLGGEYPVRGWELPWGGGDGGGQGLAQWRRLYDRHMSQPGCSRLRAGGQRMPLPGPAFPGSHWGPTHRCPDVGPPPSPGPGCSWSPTLLSILRRGTHGSLETSVYDIFPATRTGKQKRGSQKGSRIGLHHYFQPSLWAPVSLEQFISRRAVKD